VRFERACFCCFFSATESGCRCGNASLKGRKMHTTRRPELKLMMFVAARSAHQDRAPRRTKRAQWTSFPSNSISLVVTCIIGTNGSRSKGFSILTQPLNEISKWVSRRSSSAILTFIYSTQGYFIINFCSKFHVSLWIWRILCWSLTINHQAQAYRMCCQRMQQMSCFHLMLKVCVRLDVGFDAHKI
jgi:hypothetical protein